MSYIIEDNIDFFKQLNEAINHAETDTNSEDYCLISKEPLTIHHITLPCNHKFNYMPLYNTIIMQKNKHNSKGYHLEINTLDYKEIRCPYCRKIHVGLLPYIPLKNVLLILYVNSPAKHGIKYKLCNWKLTSGKNKNNFCNKNAYYNPNDDFKMNSLSPEELNKLPVFCSTHWKTYNNTKNNNTKNNNKIILGEEMIELSKKYTIVSLKKLLKNNNLKQSGSKNELVKRYFEFINQ